MRHTRWLILAALIFVVSSVGYVYLKTLTSMAGKAPPVVRPLPSGTEATAINWHYSHKTGDCPEINVTAKKFRQIKEPATFELEDVDLQLFHNCGTIYDHVESAKAQFDEVTGEMFSDGEVKITRGVPVGEEPTDKLVHIVSSGVKFETKSGKASTDREAKFTFGGGDGKCVGAEYDPGTAQLKLFNNVELNLKAKEPNGVPSKIETSLLVYIEKESKVVMQPWSRLTRDTLTLNSTMSVAVLQEGVLRHVEAVNAWGVQDDPDRKVEYQAEHIDFELDEDSQLTSMHAERKAHLLSTSATAKTEVKADDIKLEFAPGEKQSILSKATATGHSVVDSNPITKPGAPPGDTRILTSDVIVMNMKPGGKEIENAETAGPGVLEFVPNRPAQPHRTLKGDKIWVAYGADNQVQSFRTINATTHTDNPPKNGKPSPPTVTSSVEFRASFDPKTHQMSRLEQTMNFRYEQGDRKARADKATLDQSTDIMTLSGSSHIADSTGSATADQIVINQKTGDFSADGHVSSTRMPDKKGTSSAMLSTDEPMQAKAEHMTSKENNLLIHYEGNAVAWQGANRIQADKLDIDRDDESMKATGKVVSQFVDKPKKDKDGKPLPNQQSQFTIVRAPEMTYTEEERTAYYKGGVMLNRPNMNVRSRELKAFLKDKDADSSLDKAFADGDVSIIQTATGRTRTGTGEHAEYYAGEEKIILEKGQPKFVDSLKGTTQGQKLTYYSNDDKLFVEGAEGQRAQSVIRRK